MASRFVVQYSPPKSVPSPSATPRRMKRPSPEKGNLAYTTMVTSDASPSKKPRTAKGKTLLQDAHFQTILDGKDPMLNKALAQSKKVELSRSLIYDGRAEAPTNGWTELIGLFPTTFEVELSPPFLIIRVRELPSKPWPLTIGGLPLYITSDETSEPFDRGQMGRGKKILEDVNVSRTADVNDTILSQVANALIDNLGKVLDVFWWAGFWTVTVPDSLLLLESLPCKIAHAPAFYRKETHQAVLDLSALRYKPPVGVEYDDSSYDHGPSAFLRPGIMLSSSVFSVERKDQKEESYLSTTSGVLVADKHDQKFITVASHGFGDDGHVWHPTPRNGRIIGRVVEKLSDTDISIVELFPGLKYVNTTFGTQEDPEGTEFTGISKAIPPALKVFDDVFMDNPFSGRCEGIALAMGVKISDSPSDREFIRHNWFIFESGIAPVDGSCGSPIWDEEGHVVGFYRYQSKENVTMGLAAMASDLEEHGYSLCHRQHTFTE